MVGEAAHWRGSGAASPLFMAPCMSSSGFPGQSHWQVLSLPPAGTTCGDHPLPKSACGLLWSPAFCRFCPLLAPVCLRTHLVLASLGGFAWPISCQARQLGWGPRILLQPSCALAPGAGLLLPCKVLLPWGHQLRHSCWLSCWGLLKRSLGFPQPGTKIGQTRTCE